MRAVSRPARCALASLLVLVALGAGNSRAGALGTCTYDDAPWKPYQRDEADALAATGGKAWHIGDTLFLYTPKGLVRLTSVPDCNDQDYPGQLFEIYFLVRQDEAHHGFVVYRHDYEFGHIVWVDSETGTITRLIDEPHFSPKGKFFAVVNRQLGPSAIAIQIWSSSEPKLLWEFQPSSYGQFSFVRWASDDELDYRVKTVPDHRDSMVDARVVRDGNGWRRDGPPEE
jgi:hypothetical protein